MIEINASWSSDSKLQYRLKKLLRVGSARTRRFNPGTTRDCAATPDGRLRGAAGELIDCDVLAPPVHPSRGGLGIHCPDRHLLVFAASSLAILPLAGWLGRATEQLAERLGEGVGGLLNATFGNAAELIIALAALRAGFHDVVKSSIAGSIIGNMLLVLGALCWPAAYAILNSTSIRPARAPRRRCLRSQRLR